MVPQDEMLNGGPIIKIQQRLDGPRACAVDATRPTRRLQPQACGGTTPCDRPSCLRGAPGGPSPTLLSGQVGGKCGHRHPAARRVTGSTPEPAMASSLCSIQRLRSQFRVGRGRAGSDAGAENTTGSARGGTLTSQPSAQRLDLSSPRRWT